MAVNGEIYETSGGPLQLRAVSMDAFNQVRVRVEREMREQGAPLDPPTYTVRTVAGTLEEHEHTEETLESEEDRAAWQAYQAAREELQRVTGQRGVRYMLSEGVVLDGPDDEWLQRMDALGVAISDDPLERREQYLTYQYTRTPKATAMLLQRVMALSAEGSKELQHAAEEMEQFFRREMEGQTAEDGSPDGR